MMQEGAELNLDPRNIEVHWPRLLLGMFITLVFSLSVHVVMLQVLGVPFPEFSGVSAWAALLNTSLAVLSLIVVCSLAQPRLARMSPIVRYLAIFLLFVTLKEAMRQIVMNGVVTAGWGFDVVAGLPGLVSAFVLTSLVVLLTPKLRGTWLKVLAAVAIAALMIFAVRPLVGSTFAPALKAAARFNHDDIYPFPYGWQVLVPSYATFAEPVIACMLIAALIWQGLSTRPGVRLLQFSLLILLMRGMLLPTFVYSFYNKARLPAAMLSQSQFLLETLALAILTALVWQFSLRTKARAAQVSA